jgi:hypothetical protein
VCDPVALPAAVTAAKLKLLARPSGRAVARLEFQRMTLWSAKEIPPPTERRAVAIRPPS